MRQIFTKRATIYKFGNHEAGIVALYVVLNLKNVLVIETKLQAGGKLEPPQHGAMHFLLLLVVQDNCVALAANHLPRVVLLDRDPFLGDRIMSFVDNAKAAGANKSANPITANIRAVRQRVGRSCGHQVLFLEGFIDRPMAWAAGASSGVCRASARPCRHPRARAGAKRRPVGGGELHLSGRA